LTRNLRRVFLKKLGIGHWEFFGHWLIASLVIRQLSTENPEGPVLPVVFRLAHERVCQRLSALRRDINFPTVELLDDHVHRAFDAAGVFPDDLFSFLAELGGSVSVGQQS